MVFHQHGYSRRNRISGCKAESRHLADGPVRFEADQAATGRGVGSFANAGILSMFAEASEYEGVKP